MGTEGKDIRVGHHLIGSLAEKAEQPRHTKPVKKKKKKNGLAASLIMFVTTAVFPSRDVNGRSQTNMELP